MRAGSDIRLFGKPESFLKRRMGVCLYSAQPGVCVCVYGKEGGREEGRKEGRGKERGGGGEREEVERTG